jgi:hypothetical protein
MKNDRKNNPGNVLKQCIRHPLSIPVALVCLGVFYIVTLVEGQNWSGDFSLYIHHAKNMVEGKHYLDTAYLMNSVSRFVSPYAYSPVFPLLLAPVYWLFGMDLEAMKWVGVISFCLSLLLLAKVSGFRLGRDYVFFLLVVVGLNPYLWEFSNLIRADFTFTLFCYLSFYFMLRFFSLEKAQASQINRQIISGIIIGLCIYFTYGTREIGIVMPLTLLTYDIVCRRKLSILSIVAISIFTILVYLQHTWLSGTFTPGYIEENLKSLTNSNASPLEINHLNFISLDPGKILSRIIGYRGVLQGFWPTSSNLLVNFANEVLFNLLTLLAFAGYILSVFKKITVVEIFLAGYIAVLLLFGAPATIRYLIPLFPLFLYYGFISCQDLIFPRLGSLRIWVAGSYLVLTGCIYLIAMHEIDHSRLTSGITHPQAREMFDFMSEHTDIDDTIVFRKPRIMALQTGRTTATWPGHVNNTPDFLNRFFDAIEADYYVDMDLDNWMRPLTDSIPPNDRFTLVFSNTYFAVYQYQERSETGG